MHIKTHRQTDKDTPKFMTFRTKAQSKAKCIKSKFTTNKPQPAEKWKWNENAASQSVLFTFGRWHISVFGLSVGGQAASSGPPRGATTLAYWQPTLSRKNETNWNSSWNWNHKTNSPIDCYLIGLRCVYLIYFELCQLIIVFFLTCRFWLSWLHNFIA